MKKSISFVATKNIVKSDRFVARSLYKMNADLVEELGGEVVQGDKCFVAQFPTAKLAKEFVANAKTHIPKKTYDASRKTEPKKKATPKGKGTAKAKTITLTDDAGNTYAVPMSVISKVKPTFSDDVKKKATTPPKKGKGSSKPMTAQSKSHQAYLETKKAFKNRKVSYGKWKAKYEEILAKL